MVFSEEQVLQKSVFEDCGRANDLVTTNTNERDAAKTKADDADAKATEAALTAKGVSAANVARVSAAAQRARAAADGVFAYQSPAASTGGMTGGGTTGGGATTETPTDSNVPTVELGEEDVPLAGGETTTAKVKKAGGAGTGSIETVKTGGNGTSGRAGIELENEEVPLAGLDLEEEDEKGKAETGAALEDEETPLAAPIEEQSRMSWWWLILIAVLGVTGEEMYRRHRKKAAEGKELNS